MTFKQKTYHYYQQLLTNKIANLRLQLSDLRESTANETKSSAGDKYETARAMLQIEQDNISRQLQELLEQQSVFFSLDSEIHSTVVIQGSLIKTGKNWFLLSIALGKATIDNENIIALSPYSPLGKLLLGKPIGSTVVINDNSYVLEKII
ncbi:MAG: hypothetical protein ACKVOW_00945 [Chitinophagaceae bacterium]